MSAPVPSSARGGITNIARRKPGNQEPGPACDASRVATCASRVFRDKKPGSPSPTCASAGQEDTVLTQDSRQDGTERVDAT